MGIRKIQKVPRRVENVYRTFDQLDGSHPWREAVPEGFVAYRVRELRQGSVAYFNFDLAKEMGLLTERHPDAMNSDLEKKLLATFSLQIVNEYDQKTGRKFPESQMKPGTYMASRYLQLQHTDKKGKTSGDGRGIWNGTFRAKGAVWDVSSRGTGVTCLAPGAVEAGRPLETGTEEFGYGCGKAEIDELYGAALLAEMMHNYGINTERVLCIIDLGQGFGIGVRAHKNLLRPAHIFPYIKQNKVDSLRRSTQYLIDRMIENRSWAPKSKTPSGLLRELPLELAKRFGDFAARLDIDYVFAWLDWDGDNVLAEGGIIDYGSVRQFGIRHDHYRYDDVERFSTNLNEQRRKARLLVQVFAQISEYLVTGVKPPLRALAAHPAVLEFDKAFQSSRAERRLYNLGFDSSQRQRILKHPKAYEDFERVYGFFERAKVKGALRKVPDGVNRPALFDLRPWVRSIPEHLEQTGLSAFIPEKDVFKMIRSQFARTRSVKLRAKHARLIRDLHRNYLHLIELAAAGKPAQMILPGLKRRAQAINKDERMTGNALIQVVEEILHQRKRGASHAQIQEWIDLLISQSKGRPETSTASTKLNLRLIRDPEVYEKLLGLVREHFQDI